MTSHSASTSRHEGVLHIAFANPPVNALGGETRRWLARELEAGLANEGVHAIVISGAGAIFSAGADVRDFGKPPVEPSLPALTARIEAAEKPIVAAIRGDCLGGGLEIALACHWRVAAPSARLALPEIRLGLIPGAGGTQILPRLVGVGPALDMMLSGDRTPAAHALEAGLVDQLATSDDAVLAEAIAFAQTARVRHNGDVPATPDAPAIERARADAARRFRGQPAAPACIEAVSAATQHSLPEGMAIERTLFRQLVASPQSAALRHVAAAERKAARIDDLPEGTAPRPIRQIGVIGAGTMGAGIAINFLSAGIPVMLVEAQQPALDRGEATIRKHYEASVAKARLNETQAQAALALLSPTLDFDALSACDLVIEAIYENMDAKRDLFARLDAIARPGAILASNTSFLSIDELAAATARPQDVVGLHFFSPANIMKLVEVVRGAATAPDVLATAMALSRAIGKVPVLSGVCHGFIGNRMLRQRQLQAQALTLEGVSPERVDAVHTGFGMPMGPFRMVDLAGVDVGWHRDPARIESVRDALCAAGRFGQKAGAGYYDYDERRQPTPSPVTAAIVERFRETAGNPQREIGEDEIVARTLYVMVNEGARILEEGIAQRASDIDVVWINGYGWPRYTGGPMFWANRIGLDTVVRGLDAWRKRLGAGFVLSPLLVRLAASGATLD